MRGSQSLSGEKVDESTALNYSAFWNGVNLYSGIISTLPLHLKRKTAKRKVLASEHPLFRVLYAQANPFMTAQVLRAVLMAHILTWGNGYAEIVRNGYGNVIQLWPITPHRVKPKWENNEIIYEITVDGEVKTLRSDKILHLHGLGYDGLVGYSIVKMAMKSIGLGMAMETFGSLYFSNGTHPGIIVSHPGHLTQEGHQNLKTALTETYSSLGNSHRLMLLQEAMKIEKMTIAPEESQFLECVVPETLITMADGTRKAAKDIRVNDKIVGWLHNKALIYPVSAVGKPPIKNLIKIKTARGRELTASEDHPVLAIDKLRTSGGRVPKENPEKWTLIKDLKIGSYVRVCLEIPPVKQNMTFLEAYFLGAMAGDGYIRKAACSFTNADAGVVSYMQEAAKSIGGNIVQKGNKYNYSVITNGKAGRKGSPIRTLLNDSGLVGKHSEMKTVPKSVVSGGRDAWRGFLSGYFDTDGSIRKQGGKQTPAMYWSSTSLQMLQECQHLLAMLGIQSAIYRMSPGGAKKIAGKVCKYLPSWGLYVMGLSQLRLLSEVMFSAHTEKAKRLKAYSKAEPTCYREENFLYDRIVSIEEIGEGETVGIEVFGCHTHITGGIVTHNSRQFQITEMAQWFNLPPHKLKDLSRSSFNNIESEQISFVTDSILPWLVTLEQQYDTQLLTLDEQIKQNLFFKHNVEGLLRGSAETRARLYQAMFQVGGISPNDIREKEDMDPIDDPMADEYFVPMNMVPLSLVREQLNKKNTPQPGNNDFTGEKGEKTEERS
ncbi:MAG: phage portal protein [Sphaerochaeta sp.]|nr:phage portal protein [Sphaerochaeta sp.]